MFAAVQQIVIERATATSGYLSEADSSGLAVLDIALRALLDPHERADSMRTIVVEWERQRQGFKPDDDTTSGIVELAAMVERALVWYRRTGPVSLGSAQMIGPVGDAAVIEFHKWLVHRHGACVPPIDEVRDWFSRHVPTKGHGKLTTAGIVANVIQWGKLFGAMSTRCDRTEIVKRVYHALSTHRGAWPRLSLADSDER